MSSKNQKKRTALKVIGIVILVVLAVMCFFAYQYRSHIKAAIIWLTTSDEDIQSNIESAKKEQVEILNNSGFYANKEADDALLAGTITAEQHTQILLGNITLEELLKQSDENADSVEDAQGEEKTDEAEEIIEQIPENEKAENTQQNIPEDDGDKDVPNDESQAPQKTPDVKPNAQAPEKKPEDKPSELPPSTGSVPDTPQTPAQTGQSSADERIAQLVTKMYVLKSEYTGAINGVVSSMKAEFVQLPPEQRTRSAKQSIATKYLGQINAMEAQCDAQVNAIVSEVRQILKDNGRDMALADAILSTYATEKENTKAYYLSTYGD